MSAPQDTPMSENDPMNLTAAELRAEYSKALAMVHELATARAAEATQHRARLAAVEAERDAKSRLIAELEGEAKDLKYHPISGIYAIEAERDRLKAALSQITALDFEKFNGRHNFYSGAVMFVKAWLLAYAALTPQGQSTDGETR